MLPKHLYQRDLLVSQLLYLTIEIAFGSSLKVKSGCTCISCIGNMFDSSDLYLLSMDTLKTLCNLANSGGRAKRYATDPILSKISYGLINLGLSFPFFPKRSTFLHGDTFKKTLSPTSYSVFSFQICI